MGNQHLKKLEPWSTLYRVLNPSSVDLRINSSVYKTPLIVQEDRNKEAPGTRSQTFARPVLPSFNQLGLLEPEVKKPGLARPVLPVLCELQAAWTWNQKLKPTLLQYLYYRIMVASEGLKG